VGALCGRWILGALIKSRGCGDVLSSSRSGLATGSGGLGGQPGPGGAGVGARATSVRHRCHISCEVHDHHLNDATRLHQAMLSNSALEIGTINLADMDPDEIQVSRRRTRRLVSERVGARVERARPEASIRAIGHTRRPPFVCARPGIRC
jgi:hypothetical protein